LIYLVTYDIGEDKYRTKAAKLLVADGYERIQYSVFCGLSHPKKNSSLWGKLITLEKNSTEDTFKIYIIPVPDREFLSMEIIGEMEDEISYLMGKKNTLIL